MSKATENDLSDLHGVLAKVLRTQLEATATVIGADDEPIEMSMVTPALIGQVVKFLKDNNITAVMEAGDDMDALAEILKNKPQKGRAQLRAVAAKKAAAE